MIALGVKKGDRVSILSQTRLEWVQCDFGIANCGAITVGIYASNLAPDCAYILNHSEAQVIFVENQDQLNKVQQMGKELPQLRRIIIFDGAGLVDGSVPRIFEKIYAKIVTGVQDAGSKALLGGIKEKLFNWALGVGYQVSRLQQNQQPIPGGLRRKHKLAHKLVFHKIQDALNSARSVRSGPALR